MRADVLVVGNGPAGLAVAAQAAVRGLDVAVLAPDHDAPWPNAYGIWADELPAPLGDVLAARWDEVEVHTTRRARLPRAYGRIDNELLRARLSDAIDRQGGRRLAGMAASAQTTRDGTRLTTADGQTHDARIVIDASGHRPAVLMQGRGRTPAFQAAYGLLAEFDHPPITPGSMVLMDYSDAPLHGAPHTRDIPTFLYAMDLGEGRWFVEETSLAARPPVGFDVLADRLQRRLDAAGSKPQRILEVERCLFPMGVPLPPRDQAVVGFGAAAGMVHPATGYSVGAALARAPAVAAAIAAALDAPGANPDTLARAGWNAVWTPDALRQRGVHLFGLEALLTLDTASTQAFFAAFFDLPADRWIAYVSGAPSARALLATMLAVFARGDARLRLALARGAGSRELRGVIAAAR